jgi:hypothetical protein
MAARRASTPRVLSLDSSIHGDRDNKALSGFEDVASQLGNLDKKFER